MFTLLAKRFIPNYENFKSSTVRHSYGMLCGIVGIALNIILLEDIASATTINITKDCTLHLNGKKLSWLDRQEDLQRLGLWATRLYFTTENPKEVDQVLRNYQQPTAFDPGACTRGLYLRGVE